MLQSAAMNIIIEQLYSCFSSYTIPAHPTGCPCCVADTDYQRLRSKPIRQLTSNDLWRYSLKALNTWGDADQFRAILPRFLELCADRSVFIDRDMIFGKLRLADWQTWPASEQQLILTYLWTLWQAALADPDYSIDEMLSAIAQTELDLQPLLINWDAQLDTMIGLQHYADFLDLRMAKILGQNRLHGHAWANREQATALVIDWVLDPIRRERMTAAFANSQYDPESRLLGHILEWFDLAP
ncbi:hypothetical protein [Herpetosiphon giganteus]|uniref:hypothetical protein n=1 Tax=Herpetosiphon giganteus TaxID=2029754 RepID=UPI00195E9323|nr:hypothetical protein [Herpetosiphon giganteus]MBM7846755.1 hypothetical protein [Herpetosiphon giganteus]